MADVDTNLPAEPQEPAAPEPRQLTAVEQRAHSEGWVPQEEWTGDPEAWRPAKEFLDRGELFRKIEEQKRELKNMRLTIDDLGRHHAQVKQIAFKEALATLRAQKKAALDDGDHDAVVEIDERIAIAREAAKHVETPQVAAPQMETPPELRQWEARNQWYLNDRVMKGAADEIARSLVERGINDPMKILNEIENQIRKEFPHKFENPNRNKPGVVEGSSKPTGSKKSEDVLMSDQEKAIMKRIIATGVITKEKYLEEFKARQGG